MFFKQKKIKIKIGPHSLSCLYSIDMFLDQNILAFQKGLYSKEAGDNKVDHTSEVKNNERLTMTVLLWYRMKKLTFISSNISIISIISHRLDKSST